MDIAPIVGSEFHTLSDESGIIAALMTVDVTQILRAIDQGDPRASEALLPLVYDELRKLANVRLSNERAGQTLQATGLVHEAYIRLIGPEDSMPRDWDGRGHFFAAAAESMRRILIDRARAKNAQKRGVGARRISLGSSIMALEEYPAELIELDELLQRFAAIDPQKAELVKLRFFAGLTLKQAAEVMHISLSTAGRHWAYARAWLYNELKDEI